MYKSKNERGITLVTLVITIVVMCILAGVTVHQTISENGLFHSITKIGQEAKLETDTAINSTNEPIENKLDTEVGVIDKIPNDAPELNMIDRWSDYITVQLELNNYIFNTEENDHKGEYGIENIKYAIKKTGEEKYSDSNFKTGTNGEYICKFDGLSEGTAYTIGAFAEYKYVGDNGKTQTEKMKIKELEGITTFKFKFKIGDWVDYDAGTWTQEEIDSLNSQSLYYADYSGYKETMVDNAFFSYLGNSSSLLRYQFSGMVAGTSKNASRGYSHTGFSGGYSKWSAGDSSFADSSDVTSSLKTGWRVLGKNSNGQIELVSSGMPEWFLGRSEYAHLFKIGKSTTPSSYFADEKAIKNLEKRTFSEYLNDYASSVRIMNYDDVKTKAASVTNLANIGATYIVGTVKKGDSTYYSLTQAKDNKVWGTTSSKNSTRILFYKSDFSNTAIYSAGMLGVRVVVTLKDGYIPHNTKEDGTATGNGSSYANRLAIVTKEYLESQAK